MDRITQYLEDLRLHSAFYPVIHDLRQIALTAAPDLYEVFRYGGILFAAPRDFCGIFAYKSHVTVEFSAGHALADPFMMLEGKGKLRRHIRLENAADIAAKHLDSYIKAAAANSSS